MIFIDSNAKLADLLEKLVDGEASTIDHMDAKDLIVDLRSAQTEVKLFNKSLLHSSYAPTKVVKLTLV